MATVMCALSSLRMTQRLGLPRSCDKCLCESAELHPPEHPLHLAMLASTTKTNLTVNCVVEDKALLTNSLERRDDLGLSTSRLQEVTESLGLTMREAEMAFREKTSHVARESKAVPDNGMYDDVCGCFCEAGMHPDGWSLWNAFESQLEKFVGQCFRQTHKPTPCSDLLMAFELSIDGSIASRQLAFLVASRSRSGRRRATQTHELCEASYEQGYQDVPFTYACEPCVDVGVSALLLEWQDFFRGGQEGAVAHAAADEIFMTLAAPLIEKLPRGAGRGGLIAELTVLRILFDDRRGGSFITRGLDATHVPLVMQLGAGKKRRRKKQQLRQPDDCGEVNFLAPLLAPRPADGPAPADEIFSLEDALVELLDAELSGNDTDGEHHDLDAGVDTLAFEQSEEDQEASAAEDAAADSDFDPDSMPEHVEPTAEQLFDAMLAALGIQDTGRYYKDLVTDKLLGRIQGPFLASRSKRSARPTLAIA